MFFPFVFFLSCVKNFCLFSVCNSATIYILFIGGSYGNETYLDGVRVYLRNLRRSYPPFLTEFHPTTFGFFTIDLLCPVVQHKEQSGSLGDDEQLRSGT